MEEVNIFCLTRHVISKVLILVKLRGKICILPRISENRVGRLLIVTICFILKMTWYTELNKSPIRFSIVSKWLYCHKVVHTGCAASTGDFSSSKIRNGPLFGSKWFPLTGLSGSKFRCKSQISSPFLGLDLSILRDKKTSKLECTKNRWNHPVDRPKMHVVWDMVLQQCASYLPSFMHCVFCHLRQKIVSRGARFQGFWDFSVHFEDQGAGNFWCRDV